MYQVQSAWGKVTDFTTNDIAESIYAQCDAYGNEYLLQDSLVCYHKDNKGISLTEQQISIWVRPVTHKTTAVWQICYQWKDGSISWDKLFKSKESLPRQIAEFGVAQGIDHEPAFNHLVKHVLKIREPLIASVRKWQAIYPKKNHEFGIELCKTVGQTLALDVKNWNTLQADIICNEL